MKRQICSLFPSQTKPIFGGTYLDIASSGEENGQRKENFKVWHNLSLLWDFLLLDSGRCYFKPLECLLTIESRFNIAIVFQMPLFRDVIRETFSTDYIDQRV